MKYLLLIVVALLILFSFNKKDRPIYTLTSQDSILAFGDSLTFGYNAKPHESYPSILSDLSGLNVINAGIPAESSHNGLKRLGKVLENEKIKLMILFFGGNDILQGLAMQSLKSNLKRMIEMAKEKQVEVLLISVPNFSLFGFSALPLYEEVAEEENIFFLEGILSDILGNPSLKSDQIHPNARGYKIMGEKIYEKLREENILR